MGMRATLETFSLLTGVLVSAWFVTCFSDLSRAGVCCFVFPFPEKKSWHVFLVDDDPCVVGTMVTIQMHLVTAQNCTHSDR